MYLSMVVNGDEHGYILQVSDGDTAQVATGFYNSADAAADAALALAKDVYSGKVILDSPTPIEFGDEAAAPAEAAPEEVEPVSFPVSAPTPSDEIISDPTDSVAPSNVQTTPTAPLPDIVEPSTSTLAPKVPDIDDDEDQAAPAVVN